MYFTRDILRGEYLGDLLDGEAALSLDVGRVEGVLQLALPLGLAPPPRQVHHLEDL